MKIKELAQQVGVSTKTIRYYESVGLMPPAKRGENNYRIYAKTDIDRLRFIAGARSLGIAIKDLAEIMDARDHGIPPCDRVLDVLSQQLTDIDRKIANLLALRTTLQTIQSKGSAMPKDDVQGEHCVCYLVKEYRATGSVEIKQEIVPA